MSNLINVQRHVNENYRTIDLRPITDDDRLSWGAKGLHTYIISRPPSWELNKADLIKRAKNGRDAVQGFIKELRDAGYLQIVQSGAKGMGGAIKTTWHITSVPDDFPELQLTGNQLTENPEAEESTTNNNKKDSNNKKSKIYNRARADFDLSQKIQEIRKEYGERPEMCFSGVGGQAVNELIKLAEIYDYEDIFKAYSYYMLFEDKSTRGKPWNIFMRNFNSIIAKMDEGDSPTFMQSDRPKEDIALRQYQADIQKYVDRNGPMSQDSFYAPMMKALGYSDDDIFNRKVTPRQLTNEYDEYLERKNGS